MISILQSNISNGFLEKIVKKFSSNSLKNFNNKWYATNFVSSNTMDICNFNNNISINYCKFKVNKSVKNSCNSIS